MPASPVNGTVLITGASGQVGGALVRLLQDRAPEINFIAPGRSTFDLAQPDMLRDVIREHKPRWIASCAAFTAVDVAENEREAAFAANAIAPGIIAEEAARIGAGVIHLSTDYVFNGSGTRPWEETDAPDPLSVYGASKLAGEQAIATSGARHIVLRTSWVYSGGGRNFLRTMLRLLSTRTEPINVVADQHGAPTSADDLASAIYSVITTLEHRSNGGSLDEAMAGNSGVYHCTATGETTWYGLADTIREYLRWQRDARDLPPVLPVPTAQFHTTAVRPLNCRLNCQRLATNFGVRLPHWRASLGAALKELGAAEGAAQ